MNLTSQLVSGVAHEINTPLGVALTSCSFMESVLKKFNTHYRNEVITRGDLEELIFSLNDSSLSVQRSLLRSAELVNTFKQLAHDQYSQQKKNI